MADIPAIPSKLTLVVVTRERKVLEEEVDEVELPAYNGEIGILPGHTPLLALLKIGQMRYRKGSTIDRLVISWGFAEVLPDRVIVMAEKGVLASEIDPVAAAAERAEAERELADMSSHDTAFVLVEARLEESIAMLDIDRN